MRIRDRLIRGTALNLVAVSFNQGSTLIVNILVARILLQKGFGEYAMVQSTLLTMGTLSQLATGYTVAKYLAEHRSSDPERAGRIMGLCAIVATLMAGFGTILSIAIAPWLAESTLKAPHLASALMIGSGYLFFSAINGYQTGALSGLEAYGSLAKAGVTSGVVAVAAISLGAYAAGLNGAILGLSISAVARCIIHNKWLQSESHACGLAPIYRFNLNQEKRIIYHFALPAAMAGYFSMPMIWLANSFLVRQPGGYGEMALYASAFSFRTLVLFLPQVINTVSLSILNHIKGSSDQGQYRSLYKTNLLIAGLTTLAGGCLVGFFGDAVLRLFGKDFMKGKAILQILMISTIFEGLAVALYQHLQAHGRIWISFFLITIPRETTFVVLALLLVPTYGAKGLSVAYAVCWVLALFVIILLVSSRRINVQNLGVVEMTSLSGTGK